MSKNTSSIPNVFLSLLFAGVILLASYLLRDTDYGQEFTYLLIAVWFSLLCSPNRKCCLEQDAVDINNA
jgi:hypothetical protein